MCEGVDSGLDADAIGRGDEIAVGDEVHLVGAGDDPLGVGCGEMGGEQQDAGAEARRCRPSGGRCPGG